MYFVTYTILINNLLEIVIFKLMLYRIFFEMGRNLIQNFVSQELASKN